MSLAELEAGISLFSNEVDLSTRLVRSSGVQYLKESKHGNALYYDGYIPKKPWLPLSKEEGQLLILDSPPESHLDTVAVGKIPSEILRLASKLNIDARRSEQHIELDENNLRHSVFKKAILDYFKPLYIREEGLKPLTIYCGRTNLPTTTFSPVNNQLIGLHFDSWDRAEWTDRSNVRNRICINLGIEERYFLFVNLTLEEILKKLTTKGIATITLNDNLNQLFFDNFPDYPVIRVCIEPGEYYIAATENILHDGCTEDKTYNDVIFQILGYFSTMMCF